MSAAKFKGKELKEGEQIVVKIDFKNGRVDALPEPHSNELTSPQDFLDITSFITEPESTQPELPEIEEVSHPVQSEPTFDSLPTQNTEQNIERYQDISGLISTEKSSESYQKSEADQVQENRPIETTGEMSYNTPIPDPFVNESQTVPVEETNFETGVSSIYPPEINEGTIQEEITPQIPVVITDKNSPSSRIVMGCLILLFVSFIVLLIVAMVMILQLL